LLSTIGCAVGELASCALAGDKRSIVEITILAVRATRVTVSGAGAEPVIVIESVAILIVL
jgi:hypothetical protein